MSASSSKQETTSSTEKSFVELEKLADSGDADAQVNLGVLYANGQGVPKDYAQASQWWEKAAAQGYPPAQVNLGWLYYHIQDYVRARQWWRKAAAHGYAPAQFGLGQLYANGQGVPKDYAQASQWWEKAAAQGYPPAQVNLGVLYRDGQGVPQDYATARRWYEKAAAQSNAIAQSNLGWVYATINGVPAEAQVQLGQLYANGQGVPQDYAQARQWYEKAAAQGHAEAPFYIGSLYGIGQGVPKDAAKAVEWWQKAAAQGYAVAQYNLGIAYGDGRGVLEDSVLAYAWANLAAAQTYEGADKFRDSITLSSAQRAEAEHISSNWKQGQVLRRESESASVAGNTAPSGEALTKKGTGTAFVVSPEGHAITNHHVVASCKEIRLQGRSDLVQVITRDEISDLALLKMPGETRATATLAPDPTGLRQGQDIVVFGFPLD
ncbi:MAG: trypsin-like peptidase domain-containing protein, partial [Nitrospiraceae bacterium]